MFDVMEFKSQFLSLPDLELQRTLTFLLDLQKLFFHLIHLISNHPLVLFVISYLNLSHQFTLWVALVMVIIIRAEYLNQRNYFKAPSLLIDLTFTRI